MKHFIFLWKFLDNKEKAYFFYIIFLMIIQAVLEILSIALIIPFTALSGLVFFDEVLTITAWVGICCVISSLAIIGRWQ